MSGRIVRGDELMRSFGGIAKAMEELRALADGKRIMFVDMKAVEALAARLSLEDAASLRAAITERPPDPFLEAPPEPTQ